MKSVRTRIGIALVVGATFVGTRGATPAAQPPTTAIVGATIIDGNGGPAIPDGVIVINGARIQAVGPRAAIAIPPGAAQLDARGRWIIPGMIDTNVHLSLYGGQNDRYESLVRYQPRQNDIVLEFIPMYHSFGQTLVADLVQRHAKFFQHLSHPAPGRGSTGVHEAGFGRWNPRTLSPTDTTILTLNVVDDTFDKYRNEMDAVIQEVRKRSGP